MFGMTNVDYQAAMFRHEEIKREAEKLGPVVYELRQRKADARRGSRFGRARLGFGAFLAEAHCFLASLRIRQLADGSST